MNWRYQPSLVLRVHVKCTVQVSALLPKSGSSRPGNLSAPGRALSSPTTCTDRSRHNLCSSSWNFCLPSLAETSPGLASHRYLLTTGEAEVLPSFYGCAALLCGITTVSKSSNTSIVLLIKMQ